MTTIGPADVERLARLSRLRLSPDEGARLAPTLEAITREFSALATKAATLAPPEPPACGSLREDLVEPADAATVEGILAAAPRVDPTTKALRVDRP